MISAGYTEKQNHPDRQIPILAQLNGMSKTEIIGILIWKGEELPKRTVNQIDRKMKSLKKKIAAAEKEYKEMQGMWITAGTTA